MTAGMRRGMSRDEMLERLAGSELPKRLFFMPVLVVIAAFFMGAMIHNFTAFEKSGVTEWAWVGAVQSTSSSFRVRGTDGTTRRFVVSSSSEPGSAAQVILDEEVSFDGEYVVKEFSLAQGTLQPETKYTYELLDGGASTWQGSFSTPAVEGTRMDFTVTMAGCALTGSKSEVFRQMASFEPLLMVHAGDIHYADISSDSIDERVAAMDRVLGSDTMSELYSSTSLAYMWDDHDYCGNNRNSECEGRAAARKAYQEVIPHYPLQAPGATPSEPGQRTDVSPYQAFTIGTVRFILTDLRSEAVVGGEMMSPEQLAFLEAELTAASNFDIVVWVSSKPWISSDADVEGGGEEFPVSDSDNWAGWRQDRQTISNLIAETIGQEKRNLLMVSSDAHMVAYDDGRNTDYSTQANRSAGFPLLQSGPLHNVGSVKGGPYSGGCYTFTREMNNQFSTLKFNTTGEEPCVELESFRSEGGELSTILKKRLCGILLVDPSRTSEAEPAIECVKRSMRGSYLALFWIGGFISMLNLVALYVLYDTKSFFSGCSLVFLSVFLILVGTLGTPIFFYLFINAYEIHTLLGAFGLLCCSLVTSAFLAVVRYARAQPSLNSAVVNPGQTSKFDNIEAGTSQEQDGQSETNADDASRRSSSGAASVSPETLHGPATPAAVTPGKNATVEPLYATDDDNDDDSDDDSDDSESRQDDKGHEGQDLDKIELGDAPADDADANAAR